jgi:TrmH family RNA methyltransferase
VKALRRLSRRARRADRVFLVEGHRQLRCALEAGAPVVEVYAAPELFLGPGDAKLVVLAERRGARVVELAGAAFVSACGRLRPDGLAAVVERWPTGLDAWTPRARSLVLVAEGIERPGNLGTIVRTACAAGADGLVVCDSPTGVFHPDAVRGSVGTLFQLPVAETSTGAALEWLRRDRLGIVVATPGGARPHWDAAYGASVAIVVGSERHGVSDSWLDAADETVEIPMPGPADSLNVAVAAGIVLFEAARRRVRVHPGAAVR